MVQVVRLFIGVALITVALAAVKKKPVVKVEDVPIPFPGSDTDFKNWLNELYKKIDINPTVLDKVTKYVEKNIRNIAREVKTIDKCFDLVELRGSASEGLKVLVPDEFDFVLVNQELDGKIDYSESRKTQGFAYAVPNTKTCFDRFKASRPDVPNAIDPDEVRQYMKTIVQRALNTLKISTTAKVVGPAISFQILSEDTPPKKIDIDLTLSIKESKWPSNARADLPSSLKRAGAGLVAKVVTTDPQVWQITFSAVEVELFKDIDKDRGCRKKLLKITKYLKQATNWPDTVSSYQLKTLVMQMDHDLPKSADWTEAKMVTRFRELINRILSALEKKELPSFFIPSYNLLRDKGDLRPAVKAVQDLIKIIGTNPKSLFPKYSRERRSILFDKLAKRKQ